MGAEVIASLKGAKVQSDGGIVNIVHLETDAFQVKQAVLHMSSRMMFKELIQEDFISKIISHVTRGCNCVAHVTVGSTPSNPHFIYKL